VARVERRLDVVANVDATILQEEVHLFFGADAASVLEDLTETVTVLRVAGLAEYHGVKASFLEPVAQRPRLRRLARPVDPFQRDQNPHKRRWYTPAPEPGIQWPGLLRGL
jgi:hypothetical protein